MHQIQLLDWDTNFFGYKVGRLALLNNQEPEIIQIKKDDYRLIYIFTQQKIEEQQLKMLGADLYDIKIEFIKEAKSIANNAIENDKVEIKPISILTDSLFHLVLESGVHSRFKQDKHFVNHEFERLYKAWIEKTLIEKDAKVIGAYMHDELIGFVSLSLKAGVADIGLIAVHEKARGNHIGKRLLASANIYAAQHQSKDITVVTQETNTEAMRFYQHNDFKIDKRNYIYHLWL
jgi:dTDP-4-amino-4,6-dideoxy-D-galactose acyltransferase